MPLHNHTAILAKILESQYGTTIFLWLCKPHDSQLEVEFSTPCDLPWVYSITKYPSVPYQLLSLAKLKNIFMQLHPDHQPHLQNKFSEDTITLVSTFHECCKLLSQYSKTTLLHLILCYDPFSVQFPPSCELMISDILHYEFGDIVHRFLTRDHGVSYHAQTCQDTRLTEQTQMLEEHIENKKQIINNWPQLPPLSVIIECLQNYRTATCYVQPLVCASCAQVQHGVLTHTVSFDSDDKLPLNIEKLTSTDPYLLSRLNTDLKNELDYGCNLLHGLILFT